MAMIRPTDDVIASPPMHGFRGDAPNDTRTQPRGLTVALSREAGARGTTIAHKLGELLGWQVFDQEMLDYLIVNDAGRTQLLDDLSDGARAWVEARYRKLRDDRGLQTDSDTESLIRLVLAVAARGDAVIVGRGAGFLLPAETTLHVRIVSSFDARVSFLAEALRMTREEAAEEVRARDERRARYLTRSLLCNPGDPTVYDLIVNSGRLGVEGTAQFIGWAVRTKQQFVDLIGPPAISGIHDLAGS
jgi:cytidylate kinase